MTNKRFIILLSVLVIVFAGFVFWASRNSLTTTAATNLILKTEKKQVKVGEKITVEIFATGKEASQIAAFDIKVSYDKDKLKLTNATKGGFFGNYLTVRWDVSKGQFAAAFDPSQTQVSPHINSPLLNLEFTALAEAKKTMIKIEPTSILATLKDDKTINVKTVPIFLTLE